MKHLAKQFTHSNSITKKLVILCKSAEEKFTKGGFAIYVQCEDNSVRILNEECQAKSTIYPPPTAMDLVSVQYCITLDRFFLLLESGSICIYNIEKETAILEKI